MNQNILHSGGHNQALRRITAELDRQNKLWGEQNHKDGTGLAGDEKRADEAKRFNDTANHARQITWRDILYEEVLEAFAETDPEKLRTELIQVAAVAVQWVEAIERR